MNCSRSNNAKKFRIETNPETNGIQTLIDPNISQTLSPSIALDIEPWVLLEELKHEPSPAEGSHFEPNKCQTESNATEGML